VIRIGTSGYQYEAWKGSFYPEDLSTRKMLGFYSGIFKAVEINYSFYRKPTEKILAGWAAQVPEDFRFVLKVWQRITHQKRLKDAADLVEQFCAVARTLGPRLGPMLYQLPPNLKFDIVLLREFLNGLPRDLKAAFEFRHESWFNEETWQALRDFGASLCIAESDEIVTPVVFTAPWAYFRLRRLDYTEDQLKSWASKIPSSDAYVFFKHEDEARGPAFARQFGPMLER
jgi:uncharacterized protein YecE (DUF72 family)